MNNQCVCQPACAGKQCGPDGCGGDCGTCTGGDVCDGSGQCVGSCTPDCTGKQCGNDGCSGSCGTCTGQDACVNNQCVCQPDCAGKQCGDDGCSGSCGTCNDSDPCTDDACVSNNCQFTDNGTCSGSTDPVVEYAFDESSGTVANDSSGNDLDATLTGGASFVSGYSGNAVRIAGGSQRVDLPANVVQSCDDLTIAARVRLNTNSSNWSRIFDLGSSTADNMFLTRPRLVRDPLVKQPRHRVLE